MKGSQLVTLALGGKCSRDKMVDAEQEDSWRTL